MGREGFSGWIGDINRLFSKKPGISESLKVTQGSYKLITTNTIVEVPYYEYSIKYPKSPNRSI